jgi:hypothetical protein
MAERLTAEEIKTLQAWHMAESPARLTDATERRVVAYMLHLHDIIQRLQNLQAAQVTPEELEAVNDELPGVCVWTKIIAAVCRGMTQEVKGE